MNQPNCAFKTRFPQHPLASLLVLLTWLSASQWVSAQEVRGIVDFNVNVTGSCAPGYDCGQLGRQQNEPSCKVNPLNELNRLCAYNDYSLSDLPDKQGDTVIGYSESRDGQFIRRLLTGTRQNSWNGQEIYLLQLLHRFFLIM